MLRRFKFEEEIYESLNCVPMAVRRKLDRAGIKIGLSQWQALSRGERLAICYLPADDSDEIDTLRLFVEEAVQRRTGGSPQTLPELERRMAEPPDSPPESLIEAAAAEGFVLDADRWEPLDAEQRYALIKLGGGAKKSHNLRAALTEFLGD